MNSSSSAPTDFYENLKTFSSFDESFDQSKYTELPRDWHVVISDVRGSTAAIQNGRYKTINWIGACCIMAVRNVIKPAEIPFVFGGDGATFAVHSSQLNRVISALLHVKTIAKDQFGLELRVGSVSVERLQKENSQLRVGKWQMNPTQSLAMFSGNGLEEAERLIKGDQSHHVHEGEGLGDDSIFEGLSCRWNPIKAKRGRIVSLLVQPQKDQREGVLQSTWEDIVSTLKKSNGKPQIFSKDQLVKNEVFPWKGYLLELKSNTHQKPILKKIGFAAYLFIRVAVAQIYFKRNLVTQIFNTPKYLDEVYHQSDFRKLDGTLRLVLDLTEQEWLRIRALLEIRFRKGEIFFGSHLSGSAIMTCALFDESRGQHLHFMDGNDGGYALAAVGLKAQQKAMFDHLANQSDFKTA